VGEYAFPVLCFGAYTLICGVQCSGVENVSAFHHVCKGFRGIYRYTHRKKIRHHAGN